MMIFVTNNNLHDCLYYFLIQKLNTIISFGRLHEYFIVWTKIYLSTVSKNYEDIAQNKNKQKYFEKIFVLMYDNFINNTNNKIDLASEYKMYWYNFDIISRFIFGNNNFQKVKKILNKKTYFEEEFENIICHLISDPNSNQELFQSALDFYKNYHVDELYEKSYDMIFATCCDNKKMQYIDQLYKNGLSMNNLSFKFLLFWFDDSPKKK